MSEKTYTVNLTETQLRELNRACDVVSRIMCEYPLDSRTLYDMHQVFRKKLHDDSVAKRQHSVDAYDAIATGPQPLVVIK